jgi:hypothetical protein
MSDTVAAATLQPRVPPASAGELSRAARAAWLLFLFATWMLLHLYEGLRHDAIMYSMQGLAHVHPDYWSQDIYLRFGSQDQFSLFPRLYARCIAWIGLEPAAELLTGIAEIAFFLAAWRLARLLLPEREMLIGLFLLTALPGTYGSVDIFHIVEDFITPRLLSEALVLAAVLCWLKQRWRLAVACFAIGLFVHPLMTATGIGLCLWLSVVQPKPRFAVRLTLLAVVALAALSLFVKGPPLRFDDFWYAISPSALSYLLIGHWDPYVWAVTVPPLLLLAAGSVLLERQPARRLAQAGLGIGVAGIALTAYGGDLLHYTLIVQGQPWRCMWLSDTIAILLLPLIVQQLWQRNDFGRAMVLTLLAESILTSERYEAALAPISLLMLVLAWHSTRERPLRHQRLALWGAALLLLLAVGIVSSDLLLTVRFDYFPHEQFTAPSWVRRVRELMHNGALVYVLLGAFIWACRPRPNRWHLPLLVLLCAAGCCALLPVTWQAWTRVTFTLDEMQLFAGWRARIAPGTEVLFPESPLFTWVLLERPSYVSGAQATSGLFSRNAAMFIYGRAQAMRPYLRSISESVWDLDPKHGPKPEKPTLALACAESDVHFVASRATLEGPPLEEVSSTAKSLYRGLKLYQCPNSPD